MDIRTEIKMILVEANRTLTEAVAKLNESRPAESRTTAQNITNKLFRGTLKYSEAKEIAEAIGYEIVWQKKER